MILVMLVLLILIVLWFVVLYKELNNKEVKIQTIESKIQNIDYSATKGQMYLIRREINRLKKDMTMEQIAESFKWTSIDIMDITNVSKWKADLIIKKLKAIK